MVVEGLGELGANEFAETAESFVAHESWRQNPRSVATEHCSSLSQRLPCVAPPRCKYFRSSPRAETKLQAPEIRVVEKRHVSQKAPEFRDFTQINSD